MRTCPLNSSLFLSWLRLIWTLREALVVGGGDSDRPLLSRADVSSGSKPEHLFGDRMSDSAQCRHRPQQKSVGKVGPLCYLRGSLIG
jgi:hypothetical protein